MPILTVPGPSDRPPSQGEGMNRALALLIQWIKVSEAELQIGSTPRALNASFLLGFIRLTLLVRGDDPAGSKLADLGEAAARATEHALGGILLQTEQDRQSTSANAVAV